MILICEDVLAKKEIDEDTNLQLFGSRFTSSKSVGEPPWIC